MKISTNCSQFLLESGNKPAFKYIPRNVHFTKVKARLKRNGGAFSEAFNTALGDPQLRQRAIYAHGQPIGEDNQYYIFPINGYKYLYNSNITNSNMLESVHHGVDSSAFEELVKRSYTTSDLRNGLMAGSEIIFHNTPFCYAVNTQTVESYDELLSFL